MLTIHIRLSTTKELTNRGKEKAWYLYAFHSVAKVPKYKMQNVALLCSERNKGKAVSQISIVLNHLL